MPDSKLRPRAGKQRAERRRGRRIPLTAPLLIRHAHVSPTEPFTSLVTKNISLAGVYFETEHPDSFSVNDTVIASVSIPEPLRRDFPFARLAGHSRVVRVEQLPRREEHACASSGVALEFSDDIIILTATPPR